MEAFGEQWRVSEMTELRHLISSDSHAAKDRNSHLRNQNQEVQKGLPLQCKPTLDTVCDGNCDKVLQLQFQKTK